MIEIELPDHEAIIERIATTKEFTEPKLDGILQDCARSVEADLRTMVRTETRGSGLTAASIETRKEGHLTYGVGSYTRGHILRFLDLGTGIYRTGKAILIEPRTRRALRFWVKETGDKVFAMYCLVMGIIPFQFFDRATARILDEIHRMVTSRVQL